MSRKRYVHYYSETDAFYRAALHCPMRMYEKTKLTPHADLVTCADCIKYLRKTYEVPPSWKNERPRFTRQPPVHHRPQKSWCVLVGTIWRATHDNKRPTDSFYELCSCDWHEPVLTKLEQRMKIEYRLPSCKVCRYRTVRGLTGKGVVSPPPAKKILMNRTRPIREAIVILNVSFEKYEHRIKATAKNHALIFDAYGINNESAGDELEKTITKHIGEDFTVKPHKEKDTLVSIELERKN